MAIKGTGGLITIIYQNGQVVEVVEAWRYVDGQENERREKVA
jgi:hypothetical protein